MPKMIVSIDGVVIKEVPLTKDRTTLGRRPYNDVVIDNLAISGEHALFQKDGNQVYLEDLNSTNGSYVNGKAVKKQLLQSGDTIEVGKYKIRIVNTSYENVPANAPRAAAAPEPARSAAEGAQANSPTLPDENQTVRAAIKVLSGIAAGREVPLTKAVTTLGKPGIAVAAITRQTIGFVIQHVEGSDPTILNEKPIGEKPVTLKNGDLIGLAGTQMQFIQT